MTKAAIKLNLDCDGLDNVLAALSNLADSFPEFCEACLGLLEAGEELFFIDCDRRLALSADEVVMRLYPSDRLRGLMGAFGAGDVDGLRVEHCMPPVDAPDVSTTSELMQ